MHLLGRPYLVFLVLLLGVSPSALAEKRVALVIGNSAYQHTPILANPTNDAADITAVLKKLGFVVLEGRDLDKANMDRTIREFAEAISGVDVGLFFYAGHGLQYQSQNYLVPIDAKLTSAVALDFEVVRLDVVQRMMERDGGPKASLLFLDACRNNPLGRNLARALGGTRATDIDKGLAPVESGVGTLISFSTKPGDVALDGRGRNSPYTAALVKRVIGDRGDDLNSILIDVRNDVLEATKMTGHAQVPWEHSALLAKFYFKSATAFEPKDAATFLTRGKAYQDKGDYDLAIADFSQAIRLEPKNAVAYRRRGEAYYDKSDYDHAIADFSQATLLDPGDGLAYNGRGKAYSVKGDQDRAIADFSRILDLPARSAVDRQRRELARERLSELMKPQPAPTAVPAWPGGRVALVIGNSNYTYAGRLRNPANDARDIANVFRRLGFSEVLERYDLNREMMGEALKEFGDRAEGADWAVVYFAGHGLDINGANYLVPIDAQLKRDTQVADEAVSLDKVQVKVATAKKLGLIFLDAGFDNPFLARMARTAVTTSSVATSSAGGSFAPVEPEGNVLVAFASKHGTVAMEGSGEHSPYAEALLAYLETPGLELNLFFRKVRDEVRAKTAQRQQPFLYGSLSGELLYFKSAR